MNKGRRSQICRVAEINKIKLDNFTIFLFAHNDEGSYKWYVTDELLQLDKTFSVAIKKYGDPFDI